MSFADDHIKKLRERYSDENMKVFWNADKIFYNEGVDACIELAKNHFTGGGNFYMDLSRQSFINQLEQLKKPMP